MQEMRHSPTLRTIPVLIGVCLLSLFVRGESIDGAHVYQGQNEGFETGDLSRFSWEHGDDASWRTTRQGTHSGTYSAQSGSIEDGQSTTLRVTLDCVSGDITFYRRVLSESRFDWLKFYIDGEEEGAWSGEDDWAQASFAVTAGTRTFEWTYAKDGSISAGDDAAWIDDIVFPVNGPCIIEAGELRATLEDTGQGLRFASLFDLATGTEFMGPMSADVYLFYIRLRNTEGEERAVLRSKSGWNQIRIDATDGRSWLVTFESPTDLRLAGMKVTLPIRVEAASNAIHLSLRVQDVPEPWAVEVVRFPKLKLANRGPQARVFIPQGPGRVLKESFKYFSRYPSAGASMSYFAFYDSQGDAGLYVGIHDPWATCRDIGTDDIAEPDGITLGCGYWAPNLDQPGNGLDFPGEVVLQLFRGDWYDATLIYRDWVRENANWYPELSENGREDTALWMRELPLWIRSWNLYTIQDDVNWAKWVANYVGLPTGLRWYDWHQIPFDNDYPHFFPAKPGFHEAITELENYHVPVTVMPYINGTYWDTRDRGLEDFQFTDVALSGAAKNELGEPIVTSQFGQEADGGPAQLAVMCPASSVWREKQKELVLRLATEFGVKAIYMDCTGALAAQLCFDHSHDHPIGGGSWWTRSYWDLVEDIRSAMPPDCILITEGTCEAYVHVFDGFIGYWDWDDAVPAFPAIYGGAIQVFAQIYDFNSRPTMTLAHRMQGGQAFVFGEQTGGALRLPFIWHEKETLMFINQIAHLRWDLRRFFYAGEMGRPPKLYGDIPTVTADWGSGENDNWVTRDAILAGAWRIPHEQRLALLFVNVSDQRVTATLDFDATAYGLPSEGLKATMIVADVASPDVQSRSGPNPGETVPIASTFQRELHFAPRLAWAWIIEPE